MVDKPETPFSRARHLRLVPPVEDDGFSTRRHWIVVRDTGCIPEKKGPFTWRWIDEFVRELIACRASTTQITVISLTWDFDIWVEDGRGRIAEADILATVDWDEVDQMRTEG